MKKSFTPLLLVIVLALIVQSCGHKKESASQTNNPDVIPVKTITLSKTHAQPSIQVSGQLTTDDETYLSFKTGGVIRSVNVKEGDAVRRGQTLATLDLTEIKSQVAQARLNVEKAQRDFNRVSRLYKDSVATLEQFQNSQTGLSISQQQLDAASFNLSFSEIHALKDGFVLKKFVSEGQVITSGTAVLLTNGAGSGHWIVRCAVSDRDWAAVSLKDPAAITTDAFPNNPLKGIVTRKSEGTDAATGSFTIEVTLSSGAFKNLAAGMFAKTTITPNRSSDSWTIPYDALLDGEGGEGYVFVTMDNKTARKQAVRIGQITRDKVEVLSGLEDGGALIISGNAYLTDSSAIRVIQ